MASQDEVKTEIKALFKKTPSLAKERFGKEIWEALVGNILRREAAGELAATESETEFERAYREFDVRAAGLKVLLDDLCERQPEVSRREMEDILTHTVAINRRKLSLDNYFGNGRQRQTRSIRERQCAGWRNDERTPWANGPR